MINDQWFPQGVWTMGGLMLWSLATSCQGFQASVPDAQPTIDPASPETPLALGTLEVRANGEDFVRQGLLSADGWQVDFDQVVVTLGRITAYQTDPPFEAHQATPPQIQQQVSFPDPPPVDLAAGDTLADPILVGSIAAPEGHFNALAWSVMPPPLGAPSPYPLVLRGTATKGDRQVAFNLQFEQTFDFICGDYVGDDRKGFVQPGQTADLEMTLHFDHLFGDGTLPPEEEINQGALGFEPLGAIAQTNQLDLNETALRQQLTPPQVAQIDAILPNLAHVGEGHCRGQ